MCSIQFRVKIISNNQEIVIEPSNLTLDNICTTYVVGAYINITLEGSTVPCAQILEIGDSCGPIQNPCSSDPNDLLNNLGAVTPGYEDAIIAIASPVYVLTDCEGIAPTTQSTVSQLDFYDGKVIKFISASEEEGKPTCLQVEKQVCDQGLPEFNFGAVIVTDYFSTCVECLTVKPTTIEEVKKRSVSPGYNTPGCLPDYYDKVSCKFSESLYQEVIKKRYGIDFCCENDTDKWDIKKELLDLAAITDPNICETICPTNTVECNILCLNVDTCDLDFNTFTQFVTNGSADMTDLITSYLDYEVTDPILYAELDYFDCTYDLTYCLPLCFYLGQCYKNLESDLADYINVFQECRQVAQDREAFLANEYNQLDQDLNDCINNITELTNQIDLLTDQLNQCQEELQALIDAGAPQVDIDAKEKECADLQNDLTSSQNDLQAVQQNCANICGCSGSIEEVQAYLAIITTRRSLAQQFYVDYDTQIDELILNLEKVYEDMQECETCDVIFPALYGGLITYTTCGGSEISMPLAPFLKIYSQVTTDYVYSNDGYGLSNYQDLMSSIITLSEQCDELPECTDDTDLPNCLGAP
jgi:hypothetical protein